RLASAPCMRRYPQARFSSAIRTISAAISLAVSPSSKCSKRSAIILLRNQLSVPRHQCFRSHDGRHLCQQPPTKLFRPCSQPTALIVAESQSAIANLFSKNSILLDQIFDNMLLMLIHPTSERNHNKQKWVQSRRSHPRILSPENQTILNQRLNE